MIISGASASSTTTLFKQLEANGLSADKAKLVQTEATAATSASTTRSGLSVQAGSVRAALDQRIAADVSAGKLSASDAAAVKKTLDQIDGQSGASGATDPSVAASGTAQPATSATRTSGQGGGGGGGSATKTVLSQAITVVGSTKTTVTTYTDNTTATASATASDADEIRYGKAKAGTTQTGNDNARNYLSTIAPGTLIDKSA